MRCGASAGSNTKQNCYVLSEVLVSIVRLPDVFSILGNLFLKIGAQSIRDVNFQRDENGLTYGRKAMIRCGLARKPNGQVD